MAVYARGYRTYSGGFGGTPGAWTILREGYRVAWRNRGFRFCGILFLIWFVIWGAVLYSTLGAEQVAQRAGGAGQMPRYFAPASQLRHVLGIFYSGVSFLSALLALLLGAGLVSDDLRTRALSHYLVRPIRAGDYVLGKALALPLVLLWVCLLPGLLYYLLVGMWRPVGETGTFLRDNVDVVHLLVQQYLIAAASYTGLMLFLSSRTPRRGAVMGVGAAILFIGTMLGMMAQGLRGSIGGLFRYLGVPWNFESGFLLAATESERGTRGVEQLRARLPDPDVALWIAFALLLLGLWSVWRRARTVEVTA